MVSTYTRSLGQTVAGATTAALATVTQKPPWAHEARITADADSGYLLCPEIRKLWVFDHSASTYTDATDNAKDKSTGTKVILDSFAVADFIYIGADQPFRGFAVDVSAVNGGSNTSMTVESSDGDGTWTDTSATDGTASGSKSMAQDGLVTWTVPTSWVEDTVNGLSKLFWVRVSVDVVFDSEVEVDSITLLNRETVAAHLDTATSGAVVLAMGGLGGLEFTVAAGTPNNRIQWLGR
jgi:hypothetical protein